MEMHKYVKQSTSVEIDMTPMIDIVFLLIIFFMVVTELTNLEFEDVVLPKADQAQVLTPSPGTRELKINVVIKDNTTFEGEIKVGGDTLSMRDLESFLLREVEFFGQFEPNPSDPTKQDSLLEVLVRADEGVNAKHLQDVYKACTAAKIFKVRVAALSERDADPYLEKR